jgi:hypothetical protein
MLGPMSKLQSDLSLPSYFIINSARYFRPIQNGFSEMTKNVETLNVALVELIAFMMFQRFLERVGQ